MENLFGLSEQLLNLRETALKNTKEQFDKISQITKQNQQKMLAAFIKNRVSEVSLGTSTGYGYGDAGRDTLDAILADYFGCEDALIRHNFVSGTHTLTVALFGVLRPGDKMLVLTGTPYDTLHGVIGLNTKTPGSLADFGVIYDEVPLKNNEPDLVAIEQKLKNDNYKMAYIQRSRGYDIRPTLSVDKIGELCRLVKNINKDTVVMVDNCYGEFTETEEPTNVGADLIAGSLIKNAGGGIARTGGYIAGRHDLVELCAFRLTAPGLGKELGATLGLNRELYLGLFSAPHVTGEALKTAVFAAELFCLMGYDVSPKPNDKRSDIVQIIKLDGEDELIAFCQGLQSGSPVDSYVVPEPWDMPGYDSKVIMAAGAFTGGASIELSADAPLREPYCVYMQGGINFDSAEVGVLLAAQKLLDIKNEER
ncbi:MAG: methionine gamma-lyase family protein [Clostridia bacterium]|nr:methionine gamma-lyase family protein [Clostridia bacterium]